MKKLTRFSNLPRIVICGFINEKHGWIHYHFGEHSFNAQDIIAALRKVRSAIPEEKVAIHWDNCRIHKAILVREAM